MKPKLFILFAIALLSVFTQAQTAEKGKIGLTYSFNGGTTVMQPALEGSASHDVTDATAIGIIYLKPLNNWLELETGITYSLCKITTTSAPTPEVNTYKSNLSLIDIPVGLRAVFLKYFFVNGALLLDTELTNNSSVSSQTGIGMMAGVGIKYDFRFGGSLFFNPYGKIHSLVPFGGWKHHDRILESGWKFGITCAL